MTQRPPKWRGPTTSATHRSAHRCWNRALPARRSLLPELSCRGTVSRLHAPWWTSGRRMPRGCMTTPGRSCAAISSQTKRGTTRWKPSCQGVILGGHATCTSRCKRQISRYSRRSSNFPGEPSNATDGLFNPHLSMTVQDIANGQAATFHFVLGNPPRRIRTRSEQG